MSSGRWWIRGEAPARGIAPPWQFSLRGMLYLVVAIATLLVVWKAGSLFYFVLQLITTLLLPGFVAGIIYGRGADRAFCIGGATATFVAIFFLAGGGPYLAGGSGPRAAWPADLLVWPILWCWIACSGVLSVWVRSFMLRRR